MNVIHSAAELKPGSRPVCLAIGVFDGVHLGHQQVIRQAVADASRQGAVSMVVTFDQHPNAIVAPSRVPPLIYPLSTKLRVIAGLGPDTACVIHFDKAFSEIPAEQFIRGLARDCGKILGVSVGRTFEFGHRRGGNATLLEAFGKELNFTLNALAEVSLDGQPVSSTRVREAVQAGRFDLAGRLLGRPYALCGKIVQGARLGRKLGIPTANLDTNGLLTPPPGVYAARAEVRGAVYRAAVNIGSRPTVAASVPQLQVEAHLLDFSGEIYGEEIELTFLEKLRDEQRFSSLDALKQQILRDIECARKLQ